MPTNTDGAAPPESDGAGPKSPEPDEDITLEQALLAPLDSILKAQVHAARSFLNLLLQLGYPDVSEGGEDDGQPYKLEFTFVEEDDSKQQVTVPALSLVPIAPLAVDSASFAMEMSVSRTVRRKQMRASVRKERRDKDDERPWFLVDNPIDIQGRIAPVSTPEAEKHTESRSAIKINIDVKAIPMPAGLNKLMASLTHMSQTQEMPPASGQTGSGGDPGAGEGPPLEPPPEGK